MADTNTEQPRKAKRSRSERRFEPSSSSRALASLVATILGGLVLGAGIYSQWLSSQPLSWAPWIVGGGALVLAAVILWGDFGGLAVRVGDAGVALERTGQPIVRVNWSVIQSIEISGRDMRVRSEERDLSFPVDLFPSAAAWVLKEAGRRIPKKLQVSEAQRSALPQPLESDGSRLALEKLQVTGQKCKASGKVITFERDARLCPKCSEVYHHDSLPETCLTCGAELKGLKNRAVS